MRSALIALTGLALAVSTLPASAQPWGGQPYGQGYGNGNGYGYGQGQTYQCGDGDRDWNDRAVDGGVGQLQLHQRIERDQWEGRIDRYRATKLFRELKKLSNAEARACYKGFVTPWERAQLSQRYRNLAFDIGRAERGDFGWERSYGYRDDD